MTSKGELSQKVSKNDVFQQIEGFNSSNGFRDKTVLKAKKSNSSCDLTSTISKKCGFDGNHPDSQALNAMLEINSVYFNHAAGKYIYNILIIKLIVLHNIHHHWRFSPKI